MAQIDAQRRNDELQIIKRNGEPRDSLMTQQDDNTLLDGILRRAGEVAEGRRTNGDEARF